jgi:pyruvate-formate lyase-activating enzyme
MTNNTGSLDKSNQRGEIINKISPTYCLAKWLQSTILLYNGETHSCHHPVRHKITPEDIKDNPKGIHNTQVKLYARQELINGIQTKECDYCWNIENLEKNYTSDRIYKSTFSWAWPHLDKVVESGVGKDIDPTYLEVAFENTCNFKCLYCSPESSSRWQEEVTVHGPIKFPTWNLHDINWLKSKNKLPIHRDDHNPYIDAFWKWWPNLYTSLDTFRITGGEPLLSNHTWTVLEYIKNNPKENLTLAINTNLNVPKKLIQKLIDYINDIAPHIKEFDIYTSLESTGKQAEYARSGMDYLEFKENCDYFLNNTPTKVRLHFMTTVNMLSVPTFVDFLTIIKDYRQKYFITKKNFRVRMMVNYLRWPKCLSVNLLSTSTKEKYANDWIEFANEYALTEQHRDQEILYSEEVDQIKRMAEFMLESKPDSIELYNEMRTFITTCDSRRNTIFENVFPELAYIMDKSYYG